MSDSCPSSLVGHVEGGQTPETLGPAMNGNEGLPPPDSGASSASPSTQSQSEIESTESDVESLPTSILEAEGGATNSADRPETTSVASPSTSSLTSTSASTTTAPGPPPVIFPVEKTVKNVTSRERFNYASSSCSAIIISSNKEASHASALLDENKDSYMLMPCKTADKTVVVELCDDVLVEALALANYEIFSSSFKDFAVHVSAQPAGAWKLLGNFRAANSREIQAFRVPDPKLWARYIRIDFTSYHGREVFCPVSLLRVHGRTMIDELREEDSKKSVTEEADGLKEVEDLLLGGTPVDGNFLRPVRRARESTGVQRYNEPVDFGPLDMAELDVQQDFARLFQRHFAPKTSSSETEQSPSAQETAAPTTQDGIFRSMLKRLSVLERNATASSRYLQDEVTVVHHYFSLVFGRLNNISRTLQREIVGLGALLLFKCNLCHSNTRAFALFPTSQNERRNPDRLLLRTYGSDKIEVPDQMLRLKLAALEQSVNKMSTQLVLCQIMLILLLLGLFVGGLLTLVPQARRKPPKIALTVTGPPNVKKKQ